MKQTKRMYGTAMHFLALLTLLAVSVQPAISEVLYSDDFTSSNTHFDDASHYYTTPTGPAVAYTQLKSFGANTYQAISNNRLRLIDADSFIGDGVLFYDKSNGSRYNWATSPFAATILANGGLRLSFDMTFEDANDVNDYFACAFGTGNFAASSPPKFDDGDVDLGVRLKGNSIQIYDNSISLTPVPGTAFQLTNNVPASALIQLTLNSFALNAPVIATTVINGKIIDQHQITLDTANDFRMELNVSPLLNAHGIWIDNLVVEATSEGYSPNLETTLSDTNFLSGTAIGSSIGTLSSRKNGYATTTTYSLVSGTGDTDNALFQIDGSQLKVNSDFTGSNSVDGQEYSVRIQGIGGGQTNQNVFVLSLVKDDNLDLVPDDWSQLFADEFSTDTIGNYLASYVSYGNSTSGDLDYEVADGMLVIDSSPYKGSGGVIRAALLHQTETLNPGEIVYLDVPASAIQTGNAEESIGLVISLVSDPVDALTSQAGGSVTWSNLLYAAIRPDSSTITSSGVDATGTEDFMEADLNLDHAIGVYISRGSSGDTFDCGWVDKYGIRHYLRSWTAANFAGNPAYVGVWTRVHSTGFASDVDNLKIYDMNASVTPPFITGIFVDDSGNVTLNFTGDASQAYSILKSPDLITNAFGPLASPLNPTTDSSGTGQVIIPASEFGGTSPYFLRMSD